jgi:hypothetical protein
MIRYLLPMITITACGPVPVQVSKTSQEQTQRQSAEQTQSADQQSAHQSESKQGTNSMPVIIICNQNNSARATCVTPKENGPLGQEFDSRIKGAK